MDEKKIAYAEHKYARISPRKVEIICNMIRGKNADVALALMENTPKAGCELMVKVLKSAMACTASTNVPATSTSPWLRENKERRQNYGSEGKPAWVACWRY